MEYKESDLVRIAISPPNLKNLLNCSGFVNAPIPDTNNLEIGILDPAGLINIYNIPETCLVPDDSAETKKLYSSYKKTIDAIKKEADERHKKRIRVTNYLARKYKVAPDEVYAIYKAMLNYEDYHQEHFKR